MTGYILNIGPDLLVQIFWQFLNTFVLFAILTKILYKPVKKILKDRTDKIAGNIASAETKLADANALMAQYEQKMSEIEKERDAILETARKRARERETQIVEEAKQEAETIKQRARLDIEREQEQARDTLKTQIIEISSLMAGKYIQTAMDEQTQTQLFEDVLSDLGDVKWLS